MPSLMPSPSESPSVGDVPSSSSMLLGNPSRSLSIGGAGDGFEFRFYNSSPSNVNTDGDVCRDGKEVASINLDTQVNSIDLAQISQHFSLAGQPLYIVSFDVNKDAKISSIDLSQVSQQFGVCP